MTLNSESKTITRNSPMQILENHGVLKTPIVIEQWTVECIGDC